MSSKDKKEKDKEKKEWYAAFDPGKINFAFIIEEIDSQLLNECKNICPPKKERFVEEKKDNDDKNDNNDKNDKKDKRGKRKFKTKGKNCVPTKEYQLFLEKFYHCGKTILCANTDITKELILRGEEQEEKQENEEDEETLTMIEEDTDIHIEEKSSIIRKRRTKEEIQKDKMEKEKIKEEKRIQRETKKKEKEKEKEELKKARKRGSKSLDKFIFLRLTQLLDSYKKYFDKCSTIIIEQQMSFGSRVNTMAIKIAQHVYSYFLFRYGDSKTIIEFPSYNKTQLLGAPSGMDKPKRKKWAIQEADKIWTLRGDIKTVELVGSKNKKDDMSDCLLHVLAYIISVL